MKDTNEKLVSEAFEQAFDDMGNEALQSILSAFSTFAIRNPGKVIQYLHEMALDQNAYRNACSTDVYAEQAA
jgi:hypothetical protein